MSEVSPRRRWAGRLLLAGSAIALPLTASISYAADEPTTVREVELAPSSAAPGEQDGSPEKRVRVMKIVTEDADEDSDSDEDRADGAKKEVRVFKLHRGEGEGPMPDGERHVFRFSGDGPFSEAQLKEFEVLGRKFDEKEWAGLAERQARLAERMAELHDKMPVIEMSCENGEDGTRSWSDEQGRKHVIICERAVIAKAAFGLRQARGAIAANREISREVRDEVLKELDAEIMRIEKQS